MIKPLNPDRVSNLCILTRDPDRLVIELYRLVYPVTFSWRDLDRLERYPRVSLVTGRHIIKAIHSSPADCNWQAGDLWMQWGFLIDSTIDADWIVRLP